MERVARWLRDHPDDAALIRRCWRDDRRASPEDKAALARWVESMVNGEARRRHDMELCTVPECAARGKELGHRGRHAGSFPEVPMGTLAATAAQLEEARASVALDRGESGTRSVEPLTPEQLAEIPDPDDESEMIREMELDLEITAAQLEEGGRQTVLEEAQALVYGGDREADYGGPRPSCENIAALWSAYLHGCGALSQEVVLTAEDAAACLLLLKVSRFATGGTKRDTVVDMAGYAAVIARVSGIDP